LLGVVNKLFVFKSLLTTPSNILPLHHEQTFPPIIWIFTEVHLDGMESRLPFKIFSTLNLKIFLGYNINYITIWPFMGHPWFPIRKASKLSFVYFQLHLLNTIQGLNSWSWKQTNVSFEAFLFSGKSRMTHRRSNA
jgi:hypothetical protein